MAMPLPAYLQAIHANMQAPTIASPSPDLAALAQAQAPPAPPPAQPMDPFAQQVGQAVGWAPPPPQGPTSMTTMMPPPPKPSPLVDPITGQSALMPPKAPPPAPPEFMAVPVRGGGMTRAREAPKIGPVAMEAAQKGFGAQEQSIERQGGRLQYEVGQQLDELRQLTELEKEKMHTLSMQDARRQQEQMMRELDYRDAVDSVSRAKLDQGRYWANMSTGQQIGTVLALVFGGFAAGFSGRPNVALDTFRERNENDLKAQRFAYQAGLDRLRGMETGYGMFMQKTRNDAAATDMQRAAFEGFMQGKLRELKVRYEGTEAANQIDAMLAETEQKKDMFIASALQYTPAQYMDPQYAVAHHGVALPGTMSAKDAQNLYLKVGPERDKTIAETGKAEAEAYKAQHGDVNDQTRFLAQQLKDVPQTLTSTSAALAALKSSPVGAFERIMPYTPVGWISGRSGIMHQAIFGKEAEAREQAWNDFVDQRLNYLSGSGVSGAEYERIQATLNGARDTESRVRALQATELSLKNHIESMSAGVTPRAKGVFQQRGGVQVPPSAPAGVGRGWQ